MFNLDINFLKKLSNEISSFPIDKNFIEQNKLDITDKDRTSLYPWRGQFSPGLVHVLLEAYAKENTVVLDPFVGSGTTLFEAARKGIKSYGVEINPAAAIFASMANFSNLSFQERSEIFDNSDKIIYKHFGNNLLSSKYISTDKLLDKSLKSIFLKLLSEVNNDKYLSLLLITSLMLAMGDKEVLTLDEFQKAYERNRAIVSELPFTSQTNHVFISDARDLRLPKNSIDLVITSPPYINVFNYHQNYRKAMEMLGWKILEIAPSEIGSNRKHRSNRFLTVIQFCMDLMQVLIKLKSFIRSDGKVIFVIGRESKVRGVSFNNSHLLALFAMGGAGFSIERWQERKFINRYGVAIYEDIITLIPSLGNFEVPNEFARQVGIFALINALDNASEDVCNDIKQAIEKSIMIQPSPLFKISKAGLGINTLNNPLAQIA